MNVVGHPYPYDVCNSVFSTNFCLKGKSTHVVHLFLAHPIICSMASGIVIAILYHLLQYVAFRFQNQSTK